MTNLLTHARPSSQVYNDSGATIDDFLPISNTIPANNANNSGCSFYGRAYVYQQLSIGAIVFRGSGSLIDENLADRTIADWSILRNGHPSAQLRVTGIFNGEMSHPLEVESGCEKIIYAGHSLGGGLAQLIACDKDPASTAGATYNSPGMGEITTGTDRA